MIFVPPLPPQLISILFPAYIPIPPTSPIPLELRLIPTGHERVISKPLLMLTFPTLVKLRDKAVHTAAAHPIPKAPHAIVPARNDYKLNAAPVLILKSPTDVNAPAAPAFMETAPPAPTLVDPVA